MPQVSFVALALVLQTLLVIMWGCFVRYPDSADAVVGNYLGTNAGQVSTLDLNAQYPAYQDVHVMVLIGFGFLMTCFKNYSFSATGYTFMITVMAIQFWRLADGFWHKVIKDGFDDVYIKFGMTELIRADYAAASVLISFGVVIGKTTPQQLLVMTLCHLIFYTLNETIGVTQLLTVDIGGSMFIHLFGAYFGLGLSWGLSRCNKNAKPSNASKYEGINTTKISDTLPMIGTLFLWCFWPSFNAALASSADMRERTIINTLLSLCACAFVVFALTVLFRRKDKFSMVDVQNATLAGGVGIGALASMKTDPVGALLVGAIAGAVSVFGFNFITPLLEKLGIHDCCGVHNLHGLPAWVSVFASAIAAGVSDLPDYGGEAGLTGNFPARPDRGSGKQAGIQVATGLMTFGLSFFPGILCGLFIGSPLFTQQSNNFEDGEHWMVEDEHAKPDPLEVHMSPTREPQFEENVNRLEA